MNKNLFLVVAIVTGILAVLSLVVPGFLGSQIDSAVSRKPTATATAVVVRTTPTGASTRLATVSATPTAVKTSTPTPTPTKVVVGCVDFTGKKMDAGQVNGLGQTCLGDHRLQQPGPNGEVVGDLTTVPTITPTRRK